MQKIISPFSRYFIFSFDFLLIVLLNGFGEKNTEIFLAALDHNVCHGKKVRINIVTMLKAKIETLKTLNTRH